MYLENVEERQPFGIWDGKIRRLQRWLEVHKAALLATDETKHQERGRQVVIDHGAVHRCVCACVLRWYAHAVECLRTQDQTSQKATSMRKTVPYARPSLLTKPPTPNAPPPPVSPRLTSELTHIIAYPGHLIIKVVLHLQPARLATSSASSTAGTIGYGSGSTRASKQQLSSTPPPPPFTCLSLQSVVSRVVRSSNKTR